MLDLTYQYIVLAFLAVVCVLLFMGKGARVLGALDVKYEKKSRKRTPEEERKAERPVAVFLMILGITGIICPMQIQGITTVDLCVMTASALLLWLFAFTKLKVARWEGVVLVLLFFGYMYWLISEAI